MEATQGVKFLDRYAPVKLLEGSQDVLKVDAEVTIAGENGKLYGPFRVAHVLTPSPNGTVTAVAYRVQASKGADLGKMKKDELIQVIAQQNAQFAALMARLDGAAPTAKAEPKK